jgi:hypothetical protein
MTTTILYGTTTEETDKATSDGDDLWLSLPELSCTTGWELKPEGACRGDVCVPIPAAHTETFVRGHGDGTEFNVAALAKLLGAPVLHHAAPDVWSIGEDAGSRSELMMSLEAPEFELPDIEGQHHRLSDYRGKRVLMIAWASW